MTSRRQHHPRRGPAGGEVPGQLPGDPAAGLACAEWAERSRAREHHARRLLTGVHRDVEDLAAGSGWEAEYPREVWQLRRIGITGAPVARLRFDGIPQPWRPAWPNAGHGGCWAKNRRRACQHRAHRYHPVRPVPVRRRHHHPAGIDRAVLERHLAGLHAELAGRHPPQAHQPAQRVLHRDPPARPGGLLPPSAVLFPSDYPPATRLPRVLVGAADPPDEDPAPRPVAQPRRPSRPLSS